MCMYIYIHIFRHVCYIYIAHHGALGNLARAEAPAADGRRDHRALPEVRPRGSPGFKNLFGE